MKRLLFIIITLSFLSCRQNSCKLIVTLDSGEKINCIYVQSFVSGASNIKKCNGDDFQINTVNIESVKPIN